MAANCRAHRQAGRPYPVRWRQGHDHLRFVSRHEVVVEPLGVRVGPGEVLEVRWEPNETGYSVAVRKENA